MFRVTAWCSKRSRMAAAMMRSPNTSPQAPKLWSHWYATGVGDRTAAITRCATGVVQHATEVIQRATEVVQRATEVVQRATPVA